MYKFFFTFGGNHSCPNTGKLLGSSYVIINSASEMEARAAMFNLYDDKWAFCYTEERFGDQATTFNLSLHETIKLIPNEKATKEAVHT